MAKQLTQWELETIVISLEKYLEQIESMSKENNGLQGVREGIDELGKYFAQRAEKNSGGWGLSIDTRWQ